MGCHFPNPSNLNPPIRNCLAQLGEVTHRDHRAARLVPDSQVLALMDMNRDSKNLISQLTTKEMRYNVSNFCHPLSSITYSCMVIHLNANIGRPMRQGQARNPSLLAHINRSSILNQPSDPSNNNRGMDINLLPTERTPTHTSKL